jgi:hypothetical protein
MKMMFKISKVSVSLSFKFLSVFGCNPDEPLNTFICCLSNCGKSELGDRALGVKNVALKHSAPNYFTV